MKSAFLFTLVFFVCSCKTVAPPLIPGPRVQLPNGWSLSPVGRSLQLGDFPMNTALSPAGRLLAVTNNGVGYQYLQLVDVQTEKTVDSMPVAKAFYGLAWAGDGQRLYASGGLDNWIMIYSVKNQKLHRDTLLRLGEPGANIFPVGLAADDAHGQLFICTKGDSTLYVCNTRTYTVKKKIKLESEGYACTLSPGGELFVTLWGLKKVAVFDVATLARKYDLPVGDHPNEMLFSKNGRWLFVANALDNSVSILDTRSRRTFETLNAALYPDAPNGSTTNSLALSPDERTLYIANADNNCLAVFDVSGLQAQKPVASRSRGFIPTGWYPTSVRTAGNKILVANGKGFTSLPNPDAPRPDGEKHHASQYIGALFLGTLSIIDPPNDRQLATWSKQVYANTPYTKAKELLAAGEPGNPIPMRVGDPSPIKYVFYIVKENRTYDQVLGDMPEGNGDASLCLFPQKITPNQHALSREFVLLDNFYVDAEVSADGHNWSLGAYANDYVEKSWPTEYGGRGGVYDYEGTRKLAQPKGGYLWDYCRRAGLSYRTYGEFADDYKPNYPTIAGHFCTTYPAWDLSVFDIAREQIWEHDFDSLLAIGQVPRLSTLRIYSDHTSGLAKGAYTPQAAVADNDLAVGRFIEHLSNSDIWRESVVFILEDDAQDGADHVDAHRSIAFVAGPYVRRGYVDHSMYSTSGMLRTMELILGLPPMSQYDAAATPMWRCFTSSPDFKPYVAKPNQIPLDTRNIAVNDLSRISETFNLAQLDAVPDRLFNEVLWKAIKGADSEMPAPKRAAWVVIRAEQDED
ncbi:MAG: alkaline phosphatase family protein [Saprospiraceae bacterium]